MMKSYCQDEESDQDSETLKDEDIPAPSGPEEEWWETGVGPVGLVLQILDWFQTKKSNFPHLFSDQPSKIHTHFQTWPLGKNYVIIT